MKLNAILTLTDGSKVSLGQFWKVRKAVRAAQELNGSSEVVKVDEDSWCDSVNVWVWFADGSVLECYRY